MVVADAGESERSHLAPREADAPVVHNVQVSIGSRLVALLLLSHEQHRTPQDCSPCLQQKEGK